ncbi:hypothetical protein C8J57DRAFT_1245353 [Mycena rebaudengoi]|nr:hypothetical protein C8J57DRAFT_1245353 [Mycena rebaudengoi]
MCAFVNPHTIELTPETYHAGFLSGVLPTLACLRALVDLHVIAACTGRHLHAADVVCLCLHTAVAPGPWPRLIGGQMDTYECFESLDDKDVVDNNLNDSDSGACARRWGAAGADCVDGRNEGEWGREEVQWGVEGWRSRGHGGGGGRQGKYAASGGDGMYCKLHKQPCPKTMQSVSGGGEGCRQLVRATSVAAETPTVHPGVSCCALPAHAPHSSSASSALLPHHGACQTLAPNSTTTQILAVGSRCRRVQCVRALQRSETETALNNGGSGPKLFHNLYYNNYMDAPPSARIDVSAVDQREQAAQDDVLDVLGWVFDGVIAVFDGGVPVQLVPGSICTPRSKPKTPYKGGQATLENFSTLQQTGMKKHGKAEVTTKKYDQAVAAMHKWLKESLDGKQAEKRKRKAKSSQADSDSESDSEDNEESFEDGPPGPDSIAPDVKDSQEALDGDGGDSFKFDYFPPGEEIRTADMAQAGVKRMWKLV